MGDKLPFAFSLFLSVSLLLVILIGMASAPENEKEILCASTSGHWTGKSEGTLVQCRNTRTYYVDSESREIWIKQP